jgi:uncharacterized protein
MQDLEIIQNLKSKIRELFKDEKTGHDISHLERVFENAMQIQKNEGGDFYVVGVAALVHDIHRLMSNEAGKFVFPEESIDTVRELLIESNVDELKLEQILEVVRFHDDKTNKDQMLETLIIQDADALDAVGEIGLRRTLTYCKTNGIPLSQPIPLDTEEYIPDINPISTCHYIWRTMIPNARNLYTKTAKDLVEDKIKILEDFVKDNHKL